MTEGDWSFTQAKGHDFKLEKLKFEKEASLKAVD